MSIYQEMRDALGIRKDFIPLGAAMTLAPMIDMAEKDWTAGYMAAKQASEVLHMETESALRAQVAELRAALDYTCAAIDQCLKTDSASSAQWRKDTTTDLVCSLSEARILLQKITP